MTLTKKTILLKSVKGLEKKTVRINDNGDYLIIKENTATGEIIKTAILRYDVFDIKQVCEYFSEY